MFPIHNCRPARMQPGRGVRALSLLSVGLLSPPTPTPPIRLSSLSLFPYFTPPPPSPSPPSLPPPLRACRIFHFNISIFMPHLRKFKVTVRRHNFLSPPRRQRRTLPGGQDGWRLVSPPLWWSLVTERGERPDSGSLLQRQFNHYFLGPKVTLTILLSYSPENVWKSRKQLLRFIFNISGWSYYQSILVRPKTPSANITFHSMWTSKVQRSCGCLCYSCLSPCLCVCVCVCTNYSDHPFKKPRASFNK